MSNSMFRDLLAMTDFYFDRAKAVDPGPFPLGTSPFRLLERGSGAAFEVARLRVEAMLTKYPKDGREALLSRLKAREASQAGDAFFELFVLNLFVDRGFKLVAVEQSLPHTSFVVDFTLDAPDGKPLLVEVVSYNQPRELVGPKKLLDDVFNAVDSVESARFQVEVTQVLGLPSQAIPKKTVKARVSGWLNALSADDLAGQEKTFVLTKGFGFTLAPRLRDTARTGLLATLPKENTTHKVVEGVRRKLYQKAFKYGTLDVPLVVALNTSPEMGVTPALFDKAVYGPDDGNALPKEYLGYPGEYLPNGGALLERGGPLSKVPAVVGFLGVSPLDPRYELGAVYYGKYADPFDLSALQLPTYRAPEEPCVERRLPRLRHPYLRKYRGKEGRV